MYICISSHSNSSGLYIMVCQDPELEKLHADRIAALKVEIAIYTGMNVCVCVLFINYLSILDWTCLCRKKQRNESLGRRKVMGNTGR